MSRDYSPEGLYAERVGLRDAIQSLKEKLAAAFEECASIAESEKVDAESTGTESDAAYNRACDDIAAAIRARGAEGKESK